MDAQTMDGLRGMQLCIHLCNPKNPPSAKLYVLEGFDPMSQQFLLRDVVVGRGGARGCLGVSQQRTEQVGFHRAQLAGQTWEQGGQLRQPFLHVCQILRSSPVSQMQGARIWVTLLPVRCSPSPALAIPPNKCAYHVNHPGYLNGIPTFRCRL